VYTTDVIVDELEFCESKSNNAQNNAPAPHPASDDGFMNIPNNFEELPFN
jgi:single-strand DNA-binding protein